MFGKHVKYLVGWQWYRDYHCNVILIGATTEEDSLFTYDDGENHTSYFDVGYVPVFLDHVLVFDNATLGQQALGVCGNNKQCLFDIYTTGKISIGMASKQAVESFVAVVNDIETPGEWFFCQGLMVIFVERLRFLKTTLESVDISTFTLTVPYVAKILRLVHFIHNKNFR